MADEQKNTREMFTTDYLFKGKHAQMVTDLVSTPFFSTNVEVYMTAAVLGAYYQRTAMPDKSEQDTKILASQFLNHYKDLQYLYHMVMLNAGKDELSTKRRVDNAFRFKNGSPEYEENRKVFEQFMLGGVEILHEKMIKSTNTSFVDYLSSADSLIDDVKKEKVDPIENQIEDWSAEF